MRFELCKWSRLFRIVIEKNLALDRQLGFVIFKSEKTGIHVDLLLVWYDVCIVLPFLQDRDFIQKKFSKKEEKRDSSNS